MLSGDIEFIDYSHRSRSLQTTILSTSLVTSVQLPYRHVLKYNSEKDAPGIDVITSEMIRNGKVLATHRVQNTYFVSKFEVLPIFTQNFSQVYAFLYRWVIMYAFFLFLYSVVL